MSDPLPPLPEPFASAPRPLRSPGCGRGALIGCGMLIAVFGIGAVALTLNADKMLVRILQYLEAKVEEKLPPELTPAERERLPAAFKELYAAVAAGTVQPAAVQSLQRELFAVAGDVDRGLTREQVLALVAAVEEAAGHPPPPDATAPVGPLEPAAPAPAVVPSPTAAPSA